MPLILSLLLALPALSAEKIEITTKAGAPAVITLVEAGETARLRLEEQGAEPVLSEVLGEEFQEFTANGKTTLIAAQDLDKDGTPEVFVRTTLPPRSGQFFAFRLEGGKLVPVKFGEEEFLEVSHGGAVSLGAGKVDFEEEGEKRPLRRTVRFHGQAFTPPSR